MAFKIKTTSSLSAKEENDLQSFLEKHEGLVFHEIKFNRIVSEFFKTTLIHYLVYTNNELVAFCTGNVGKNGVLNIIELKPPYDVPFGGFVFDKEKISLKDLLAVLPQKFINNYIYSSAPDLDGINQQDHLKEIIKKETAIVDLSLSEDNLWNDIVSSKRRNMIRKAQKEGITTEIRDNEMGLKLFWPILNDLHQKLGFSQLAYQYYANILDNYFYDNKAIIILARKNGEIISGVIIIGNKYMMHYWKGASKDGIKNEGQGDLLQWEAIKWAKNNHTKYYDLCVIDPEKLPHIAKFKLGFSKQVIPFYYFSNSSYPYRIINKLQKRLS